MILKGPRYFLESFFEGWVVQEELCFYKSFVSSLELWRRDPVLVCGLLIVFLKLLNIDSEFAMVFLEASD
jgi:hypothetical protein